MTLPFSNWKNKKGTSGRTCSCGSWKNHWINNSHEPWPAYCSVSGCYNMAEVGAHMINSLSLKEWIVPACKECNSREDSFSLKPGIILVQANTSKSNC